MSEYFEYMDTILTEYREWCDYEADMETNPYDDEEWPDDLFDEVGFDPYEGCYTGDC